MASTLTSPSRYNSSSLVRLSLFLCLYFMLIILIAMNIIDFVLPLSVEWKAMIPVMH